MAVLLQFHRENHNTSWGFRLTGGADYDLPLTVIKVTEGSIAENVGMKVGDLLVRVGDTATAGLAHLQAHDLIKNAGDTFEAAVIRGELPEFYTETEQTFDSETTENGMSQSLQINIKTNVVDKTEIIVETGEIIEQNIKINGSFVNNQQEENMDITLNTEEKVLETEESTKEEKTVETSIKQTESTSQLKEKTEEKDPLAEKLEKVLEPPECIKQSEVLKVIKEETKASETKEELLKREQKRWTTFLQKPKRPKPKIKQKETEEPMNETSLSSEGRDEHFLFTRLLSVVQEPPYRVIIQKQKKKKDEEKAKAKEMGSHSQQSTPIPEEIEAPTPELTSEQEFEVQERQAQEEMERQQEEDMRHEESEQQTEEFELTDEPMISEVEMSLEDQLAAIQRQLLALTQLPAAIQQTLDAVTQQLTKIVGPVNDPNTEEKELEEEDLQNSSFEDTDKELEDKTEALETLEEVSESGLDSQHADQEITSQRSDLQSVEENKTEAELESEMLQATPETPDELLTPEEREAKRLVDKKHKEQEELMQDLRSRRVKDRPNYPLTPLPRPICLPGGKKWHAPDDAHPSPLHRHHDMSDDLIAETISSQSEILTGTTLGINFLKFQPPPKTLDHLKNSEVYKMIHEMDEQPLRGVGARQGKSLAEEDYYSQMHQEGQMKG